MRSVLNCEPQTYMLTCRLVPRRGNPPQSPFSWETGTVFSIQNGMEWILDRFTDFYIGTANIDFECCMDFRISGVQDGAGVVQQNGVRVAGSLLSSRLDKCECRMVCRVGIFLSCSSDHAQHSFRYHAHVRICRGI